jgi:hypothetical protein
MRFYRSPETPDLLRPFFPYNVVVQDKSQLLLKKLFPSTSYFQPAAGMVFLLAGIYFSDSSYYTMGGLSLLSFILTIIGEGYQQLDLTPRGLTLVRHTFFYKITTVVDRNDVQSVTFTLKRQNEFANYSRIKIVHTNGNNKNILLLQRKSFTDLQIDTDAVAKKISDALSLRLERVPPNQSLKLTAEAGARTRYARDK